MSLQDSSNEQKARLVLDNLKKAIAEHPTKPELFRDIYRDKPIRMIKTYEPSILFPKKFREIFGLIWLGRAGKKIIITGPRGGGKSVLMGTLGFCLWFLKQRSIVDMGGSLNQAKIVYGYYSNIVYGIPAALKSCKKDPLMEHTESKSGNYFKALPASPKAVRGPHPDVLMLDEACEAKDEIIADALPMVTSSPDPLTIMSSTFHKIFGAFQETWDKADELGYTRFSWDIFDVTLSFDPDIWNDKDLRKKIHDLDKLKELSKGRTGDPEGWVRIENIIDAWQGKRSVDWFLTEFMGLRPSASGLVNDPIDVEDAMFDDAIETKYNYKDGAVVVIGIDWGFSSMTSVVALMEHLDGVKVKLENENYTQVRSDIIIEDVVDFVAKYKVRYIYADSAGKFENEALQLALDKALMSGKIKDRCYVVEVVFRKDKEEMIGNYRAHFQNKKMKIPESMQTAKWQHKRYRYVEGTNKPEKKDDHIPDATMCALKHFPLPGLSVGFKEMVKDRPEIPKPISSGILDERF